MYKRAFLIVIDSVGCGELPDAALFGDVGANTIKHIADVAGPIKLPNMEQLGYGHLTEINGVSPLKKTIGNYSKMAEISNGKDTMTGHWEIMGLKISDPFIKSELSFKTLINFKLLLILFISVIS